MKHVLEFDSIEISFGGRRLLNDIYMVSETGAVTGLLGRNGCGKTTLLKIVFGSLSHEQKSVRIDSQSLGMNYLLRRRMAYLPQGSLIPPYLTLRQAFSLFNVSPEVMNELVPEAAKFMDLHPDELSGGSLRIFEVALVLKSTSPFCLLDEPFTGMTPLNIEKVKGLIDSAKAEKGIIMTDHLYQHVAEMSDRIYLLRNGKTYAINREEQLVEFGYVSHL